MVRERNPSQRLLKVESNKLKNFPKVYYISLEESVERRKNLEDQFSQYGITPIPVISKRWSDSNDIVNGPCIWHLDDGTKGALVSHLKMLRRWYEETNDEYGFFCEDDLSLETVKYWNFTWEELIQRIPQDAMGIQMLIVTPDEFDTFDFKIRRWNDWAATAYLLKREYVERLVKRYCVSENEFYVEIFDPYQNMQYWPLVENAVFKYMGEYNGNFLYGPNVIYSIPLFIEDVWNFNSTFPNAPQDVELAVAQFLQKNTHSEQKGGHFECSTTVLNYWKNKGKDNE